MQAWRKAAYLCQDGADSCAWLDPELEALFAAHGLLDGRLALVAEFVVLDVELWRRQHALRGI